MNQLCHDIFSHVIASHLYPNDIDKMSKTSKKYNNFIHKKENTKIIYSICKHIYPHGVINGISYKDGKKNGISIFYRNNTLVETNYKNDTMSGPHTVSYPNKNIKIRGYYLNGKKQNLWETFHKNGHISERVSYKNDTEIGLQKKWNSDGECIWTKAHYPSSKKKCKSCLR
jgi:antitoxin component YwqK of YwqJK toxin-antitoxin module